MLVRALFDENFKENYHVNLLAQKSTQQDRLNLALLIHGIKFQVMTS